MRISLKAARVNANMTQEEAAKKIDVHRQSIMAWENGDTPIKTAQLMALCQVYNVSIDDIILPTKSTSSRQS